VMVSPSKGMATGRDGRRSGHRLEKPRRASAISKWTPAGTSESIFVPDFASNPESDQATRHPHPASSRNPRRTKRATRPRGILIQLPPGIRVEPRERPGHEASSFSFLPESGSNQESDQTTRHPHPASSRNPRRTKRATRPRGILIQLPPGIRVKPRERPGHEASSSSFLPESGSNQESDQAAPLRYEIGLARRKLQRQAGQGSRTLGEKTSVDQDLGREDVRSSGPWGRRRPQFRTLGEKTSAVQGLGGDDVRSSGPWARRRPQHQGQGCRDREFLRLPSSTLHETRRPGDRDR